MKNLKTTIPLKNRMLILFAISLVCLSSSAQDGQTDKIITDEMLEKTIDDALDELNDTDLENDMDNDGVPDEADLCPKVKGSLKFYGCLAKSEEYFWDNYEYEAYPARTTLEVTPAKFDTIIEKYLVKPAHKEGAIFETITEQVIQKEAHSRLEVIESDFLKTEREIVIDQLTNKTIKIESYELANSLSTKEIAVPAEYKTLTRQKVVENGTGAEVEAEYKTYTKLIFASPAFTKEVAVPAIKKVLKIRTNMEEPEIFEIVEEMPVFPGGDAEMLKSIYGNIIYPTEAKAKGIEGLVVLSFTIYEDGSVHDVKVLRDIGGGCGEEAARLVKLMPKWKPGKQRGKPVKVAYKLPVRFGLGGNKKDVKKNKWFNRGQR